MPSRPEVRELVSLGRFPPADRASIQVVRRQQELLDALKPSITSDELAELIDLFGPDDYYGLAWTLLHLIETAPGWPVSHLLTTRPNEWTLRLRARAGL